MLERYEVEAFLTLAEELHFGRTGERLGVSTARVSQTIRKLERRVGVPLFDRTSRRVEPTPAGRRMYEEIKPAWQRISAAVEQAVNDGRGITGTLTVAFVGAAAGQLLVGVAELFRSRFPECEVRLREVQPSEWGLLRDGKVDLLLSGPPVTGNGIVNGAPLVRESLMLAVAAGHPFASRTSVSAEDLARVAIVQLPESAPDSVRAVLAPRQTPSGRPIEPGPVAETLNEALVMVSSGNGGMLAGAQARRYYARPDIVHVPVTDAPLLEWGLSWRAGAATARVRAFADAARDLVRPDL